MIPTSRTSPVAQPVISRGSATQPQFYVPIPQRLATLLYDTPLAIGVYALVARLHQISKAPVPLSVPDLLRYDPALSRGAAIRALDRLTSSGYLLAQGTQRQKRSYLPTWGHVRGTPLAWDLAAPCLGRPRHIHAVRLDQRLFDTYMGKLTPHPARAATITRYLTAPLLGIADIGVYALALAGIPRTTTALERLSLIRHGEPQLLMSDARLLALASQQTLGSEPGTALTASGARKLGVAPILPSNADTAQPLFFVPPALIGSMIGPMIGSMIGRDDEIDQASSALQREKIAALSPDRGITWINMEDMKGGNPPPYPPDGHASGGGRKSSIVETEITTANGEETVQPVRRKPAMALPTTEAAQLLHTINARPEVIAELASVPAATVRQAIADAQARPYVRDIAAWAVSLLRAHRDHRFAILPPAPPANSAEALQRYFADQAAQQEAERAAAPSMEVPPASHATTVDPLYGSAVAVTSKFLPHDTDAFPLSEDELATVIRRELRWRLARSQRPLADQLAFHIRDDALQLVCRRSADIPTVQTHILPMVRHILGEQLGTSIQRVTVAVAGPLPAVPPSDSAAPSWITPARWETLAPMLRAALSGATVVDGRVRAASEALTALLYTRYATEIATLVDVYDHEQVT